MIKKDYEKFYVHIKSLISYFTELSVRKELYMIKQDCARDGKNGYINGYNYFALDSSNLRK